jgi:hypothetical protein
MIFSIYPRIRRMKAPARLRLPPVASFCKTEASLGLTLPLALFARARRQEA